LHISSKILDCYSFKELFPLINESKWLSKVKKLQGKILIVDDEPNNVALLEQTLQGRGGALLFT
jgi:PleD family two-component response regulator